MGTPEAAEGHRRLTEQTWFRGLLCVVALIGTVALATYQRWTGPSWPIHVDASVGGARVTGELPRSHGGAGGAAIDLYAPSREVTGKVVWRRYPTSDPWEMLAMSRVGSRLIAELPHQPPAGKLEYSVRLEAAGVARSLPADETAVIRFRGEVPAWILIPHILFMFLALTVVLRAGFALVLRDPSPERFIPWILLMMVPGGLVLGPIVQKHAFGAYWTGWPLGDDWTDNKTLAAVLGWVVAWAIVRAASASVRGFRLKLAAMGLAVLLTLAVYLIPHSVHGSELDWSKVDAQRTTHTQGAAAPRP
jgi:hypothetical protein